jgi:hypothetical protein
MQVQANPTGVQTERQMSPAVTAPANRPAVPLTTADRLIIGVRAGLQEGKRLGVQASAPIIAASMLHGGIARPTGGRVMFELAQGGAYGLCLAAAGYVLAAAAGGTVGALVATGRASEKQGMIGGAVLAGVAGGVTGAALGPAGAVVGTLLGGTVGALTARAGVRAVSGLEGR